MIKGVSYKSEEYSTKELGHPFLNLKSIKKYGGFNPAGVKYFLGKYKPEQVVKEGEILIANTDLTRDAHIIGYPMLVPQINPDKETVVSMDISIIRYDKSKIDKDYLYYLLQSKSAHRYIVKISAGSTVLHLQTSKVGNMPLEIPNLETQKKESEKIRKIDDQIKIVLKFILDLKNLRNKLSNELLSGKLRLEK